MSQCGRKTQNWSPFCFAWKRIFSPRSREPIRLREKEYSFSKFLCSTFSQNFWFVVDLFKILICTKWFVCTFKNRFNSYNPGQNYVLGTSGIWRCVLTLLARIVDKFRYYLIYFLSQFWLAVKPLRQLQITSHSGEWRLSPEFSRKGKSVCTQATNNRL